MENKIILSILFLLLFFFPGEFLGNYLHQKNIPVTDYKVISSNSNSITIEYDPVITDSSIIKINNQEFLFLRFLFGSVPNSIKTGDPAFSIRPFLLGVPSEYGNTIEIVESSFKEIEGRLAPRAKMVNKNGISALEYVISDNYYKQPSVNDLVSFGDYGQLRGIPVQSVMVSPVDFNPSTGKIKLYTRVVFRINYSPKKPSGSLQVQTDDLLKDALINYEVAKVWSVEKRRTSLDKTTDKFNSLLSQGKWYRFEAPEEGIYKITPEMLTSIGLNPQTIDPKTIKIYNNGGKAVSEVVGAKRAADLEENAVYLSKQLDDGKFNAGDYILFYGRGIHFFDYDTTGGKRTVKRYYHPYSKANYFFLTYGGNQQKTMSGKQSLSSTSPLVQQSTQAYTAWEEDKAKFQQWGRKYFGDALTISQKSLSYRTDLYGLIPKSKVIYNFNLANRTERNVSISIEENSNTIYKGYLDGLGVGEMNPLEGAYGKERLISIPFNGEIPDGKSLIKISVPIPSINEMTYLDYFEIYYQKQLKANSDQLVFYSPDSTTTVEYHLSNFSNTDIKVFDVTDYKNLKIVTGAKASGGDLQFQSSEVRFSGSKYLAIGAGAVKSPSNFAEVTNSNLHGMTDEGKFIVITHRNFLEQAKRLKSYKESQQKISTVVVDVQDIFNEFSCGVQDVSAIRDFIKYAYDNWAVRPEYVLLFGDGDYDYKDIEGKHQNFIIPYEELESMHNGSLVSDDFYSSVSGNDWIVDLALGRIVVKTVQEAQEAIDKIIKYDANKKYDLWRNTITIVADDNYNNGGYDDMAHTGECEGLSDIIPKSFDLKKIYSIRYQKIETSTGTTRPMVYRAIIDAINSGTLMLTYVGHGGMDLWAMERIFTNEATIPQLKNDSCLFFLTAATCSFGRCDFPGVQSGAEQLLLKPDGGAIGVIAAARGVVEGQNMFLNNTFYINLLRKNSNASYNSTGRAYFLAKSSTYYSNGSNDSKFFLFGDPTLKLSIPQGNVTIESINGKQSDTVKALSKVKIEGTVRKADNSLFKEYTGECLLTIFDSETSAIIQEIHQPIIIPGGTIYRGRVSISGGRFTTDFIVPKDISYQNEKGKVEAYVHSGNSDGIGYSKNIIVGGTDTTSHDDKKGPEVTIAFDQPDGDNLLLVKPTFNMYVKLKDQTGLNLTGTGIGHRLEAVLNGNESQPIDLTGEYTGDLDSGGKSGVAVHQFTNLQAGDYRVSVKAWDVFNNSTESEKSFTVSQTEGLVIKDVYNYPNPFKYQTTFTFQHNFSEPLNVKIKIYTIAGRMIRQIENPQVTDRFVKMFWDGKDQDGNMIANGTYLYKLIVRTISDSNSQEVLGKLAVIR